jgi:hypothetical protein
LAGQLNFEVVDDLRDGGEVSVVGVHAAGADEHVAGCGCAADLAWLVGEAGVALAHEGPSVARTLLAQPLGTSIIDLERVLDDRLGQVSMASPISFYRSISAYLARTLT